MWHYCLLVSTWGVWSQVSSINVFLCSGMGQVLMATRNLKYLLIVKVGLLFQLIVMVLSALFFTSDGWAVQEDGKIINANVIAVPENVLSPPWMEYRRNQQLATRDMFDVYNDFQFSDVIEESGIQFSHRCVDDSGKYWKPVHYDHGNGIAAADIDGDGFQDIYFTNQVGGNELYKNLGNGKFKNITEQATVALVNRVSVAASFADIDNDGDPDLFVTTIRQGNVLFENRGKGNFKDVTESSGLGYKGHSSAGLFFDFDRDGRLDLFLANVGVYTTDEVGNGGYFIGVDDAFGGHLRSERAERSRIYRNLGDLHFKDVSDQLGFTDESWNGDTASIDANEDGWPDLYVLNMQGNDEYYENVEGKKFVKKSRELFPQTPWGSMGIQVFDFNNNGRLDLFITDMHSDMSEDIPPIFEKLKSQMQWSPHRLDVPREQSIYGNAFFINESKGKFREASDKIGAENYWPWGLSTGDLNADGYTDVFIAASMNYPFRYGVNSVLLNDHGGVFRDSEFILGVEPRRLGQTAVPWFELNCDGDDKGHRDCEGKRGQFVVWGALGTRASIIFDLDDDGDLDIVTNEFNSKPMVLVSDLAQRKELRYLKIKLIGTKSNRSSFGARVTVKCGNKIYTKLQDGKSGYLSQSLIPLYFGLDTANSVDQIQIAWPSGKKQLMVGPISTNQLIEIEESQLTED